MNILRNIWTATQIFSLVVVFLAGIAAAIVFCAILVLAGWNTGGYAGAVVAGIVFVAFVVSIIIAFN